METTLAKGRPRNSLGSHCERWHQQIVFGLRQQGACRMETTLAKGWPRNS